jgi:hypothetical protein
VADGDTIRVRLANGRYERVRLIGIDTPETKDPGTPVECGGPHATGEMLRLAFTEPEDSDGDGLLDTAGGEGRSVTLRTDPTARRADSLKESQLAAVGTFSSAPDITDAGITTASLEAAVCDAGAIDSSRCPDFSQGGTRRSGRSCAPRECWVASASTSPARRERIAVA